jgi:F-type H+-transporting ATPase subunit a
MFILAATNGEGPVLSADAPTLFHIGPLEVTNSMIYAWIIILGIFLVVRLGTRRLTLVPSGLQNLIEAVVEGLENATKGLLEAKVVRWCFPLVATYFIFILLSNLAGLLPGVGSLGFGHHATEGFFAKWPLSLEHADRPLLRPPTADANMTIALAAIFFIMSTFWAIKYNGFGGLVKHLFGVKGGMKGLILIPLSIIFIFVGLIEVIAIMIRPVALSMRLYGNVYGGESVLTIMLGLLPFGLAAIPFYVLEIIVAVVQALVFTLLCIAFIGTLCSHTDTGEGEHHAH